jgi:EmrB/QacA subfamily drug resistance transporter
MTTQESTQRVAAGAAVQPDAAVGKPSWGTLLIVLAGTFITNLDFFIVNVAIPSIQRNLHAGPDAIQFIAAGFNIGLAVFLITGGRLGDMVGRRRMFMIGVGLFTVASLVCGIAPNAGDLIAARIVQGVASALVLPNVLAILNVVYTGKARIMAFNAYGITLGFSAVFGQLIGGLLIKANIFGWEWRTIFLINVPIGLIALALTKRNVPESRSEGRARLDVVGTILVTLGLVAIVLPLVEGRQQGWPEWAWILLIAAVPLLVVFAVHQNRLGKRGGAPLINLKLFRERAFTVGTVTTLIYFSAMASFFLVLALFVQYGKGLSPLQSGLFFIFGGAGFFGASAQAPALAAKVGKQVLAIGGVVVAVGDVVFALLATDVGVHGNVMWLAPALFVCGYGMGLVTAPLTSTVLAGVVPEHAAAASGVLSTAQEVGNTLGVAVIGAVFFSVLSHNPTPDGYPHAFDISLIILAASSIVVAVLAQLLPSAPKAAVE